MITFESEETGICGKIKDFWVYDVYASVRGAYYDVRNYLHNLWLFHKKGVMWRYRTWDYCFTVDLFKFSVENLRDQNDNEIDETRLPKVEAMTELIRQLNRDLDEELPFSPSEADNRGGYVKKYNEEYKRLRDERYEAIFHLIKGNQEIKGSGIESWWD